MTNINKEKSFSWIDSKVIYSLSFLLILFTLKDPILLLFPSGVYFEFLWISVSPEKFLGFITLILFMSIYFYGVNYIIKNPLNKIKRYFNHIASALWFISFFSPFYLLIILFFQSVLAENGIILTGLSFLFVLSGIFISIWSERKERKLDSMEFDEEIEKLKLEPANKDNVAEFLRYYLIMEFLVKDAIVEEMKIQIDENESIDINVATTLLFSKGFIKSKTKEEINKLNQLRNRIVHEEYKISEKEIEQIKDTIKNFDLDIKTKYRNT